MTRSVVSLHFDEKQGVAPADAMKGLADLTPPAGLTAPTRVDGIVGGARSWAAAQGYTALEQTADQTRLTRGTTVEAIVNIPWKTTNGTYTIVQRGKSATTAETILYRFRVIVSGAPGAPVVSLQLDWDHGDWDNGTGALAVVAAVAFSPPDGWWYIAAARRWISPTSVAVDLFVNDLLIGTVTSAAGDILGGVGGTTMIGCNATPTGMPSGAKIDEIRISGEPRSAEELLQVYRKTFVYPVEGYDLMRALLPPGDVYSKDPGSKVQREVMVEGDGISIASGLAQELASDYLPDRAWSKLDAWENVTKQLPGPQDDIATRRARVLGFLRTVQGYSRPKIAKALAPVLGMTEAQVIANLYEHSNRYIDAFDGVALRASWTQDLHAGTLAVASGKAKLTAGVGIDARWTGDGTLVGVGKPIAFKRSIPAVAGMELVASIGPYAFGENGAKAGIFVRSTVSGEFHQFGIEESGGAAQFFHATYIAGVYVKTLSGVAVPANTLLWLRYRDLGTTCELAYRADGSGFDGGFTLLYSGIPTSPTRQWAGAFVADDAASTGVGSDCSFADLRLYCPQDDQVWQWYVFADPAIVPGADVRAAQAVVGRAKPGHTIGKVTQSSAFMFGDAFSVYGISPYGVP